MTHHWNKPLSPPALRSAWSWGVELTLVQAGPSYLAPTGRGGTTCFLRHKFDREITQQLLSVAPLLLLEIKYFILVWILTS